LNICNSGAVQLTRFGSPSRERAFPALARAAIAIAVVAAFLLSPIGLRPAFANEDPRDRPYVMEQVNQALETQRTMVETRWSNPETGNGGTIVVDRTFYRDTGEPCRDYRRTLDRSGAPPLVIEGTGCRVSPARWEIVEKTPAPPERSKPPTPGTKKGAREPAPAEAKKPTPKAAPAEKATAAQAPVCPDPAALAPPVAVVKAPCAKPAAFTDYTLPSKAEL
jgi:surface antigen